MMLLRRTILSIAAVLLVHAGSAAQSGISGMWAVTIAMPDGPVTVDANFQQKGETVVGQIDSPVGMVDFVGTFTDGQLMVSYTMDVRGRSIDVEMSGVLEGETLGGIMSRSDVGDVDWTAKRKK
jgi:hypothetical protein